jgi:hypothetical protein
MCVHMSACARCMQTCMYVYFMMNWMSVGLLPCWVRVPPSLRVICVGSLTHSAGILPAAQLGQCSDSSLPGQPHIPYAPPPV